MSEQMRVADAPPALRGIEQRDPSPVGNALALVGATLAVAVVSLPLWDPDSLREAYPPGFLDSNPIDNRLLIHGGWLFIGIALACAVSVVVSYLTRNRTHGPIIAGIVAISLATLAALTAPALMPQTFAFSAGSAAVGLGVHTEMVAGLLMLIGGLRIRRSVSARALAALGAIGVVLVAGAWWTRLGLSHPAPPHTPPSSKPPVDDRLARTLVRAPGGIISVVVLIVLVLMFLQDHHLWSWPRDDAASSMSNAPSP